MGHESAIWTNRGNNFAGWQGAAPWFQVVDFLCDAAYLIVMLLVIQFITN